MKQKSLKVTLSALSLSVALLASGQAMATAYYSIVANPTLTTTALADGATPVAGQWAASCTGAAITTAFSSTAEADTFTLCGTGGTNPAVATMAAGAFGEHAASLTIQAGAKLTLSGNVTSGTDFALANEGTLTIPAANTFTLGTTSGAYTSTAGVLESTCTAGTAGTWTTPATWGTTTRCGLVTAATSTVPASPNSLTDVVIGGVAVTGGTGTVKSLTLNNTSSALTLGGAMTVTGHVVSNTGSSALTIGANTLTLGGNLTTAAAGSVVGTGSTLALTDAAHDFTLGGNLTVATLTLATPTTARLIKLLTASSTITATTLSGFATCSSTASPTVAAGALSSPIASTNGGSGYSCAVPTITPVNASVDIRESGKVNTTSEEIIIK